MAQPTAAQEAAIEALLGLEAETVLRQVAYRAMDLLTEATARDRGATFQAADGSALETYRVTSGTVVPVGTDLDADDARYDTEATLAGMTGRGAMLYVIYRDDNDLATGDLDDYAVQVYWEDARRSWGRPEGRTPLENARACLEIVAARCDESLGETRYALERAAMGREPEATYYDVAHCPIGEPPTDEQRAAC